MTTTEHELGPRLRRELAELATVPAREERQAPLDAPKAHRPVTTVAIAVAVVVALVVASVTIARAADHRHTAAVRARVYTALQPPAALTGTSQSVVAKPFWQVCSSWRLLSAGLDCRDLQARYVWQPKPTTSYAVFAIEVVGVPDPKIAGEGPAYAGSRIEPVDEHDLVRGHVARVHGSAAGMTVVWQERPNLQILFRVTPTSVSPGPAELRERVLRIARGMRAVAIDSGASNYVLRHGMTVVRFGEPTPAAQPRAWTLTWRPSDRSLCTRAGALACVRVPHDRARLAPHSFSIIQDCPNPWIGDDGIAWGTAPPGTARVAVSGPAAHFGSAPPPPSTAAVSPPGHPELRVYALALPRPSTTTVEALDASGHTLAIRAAPPFVRSCGDSAP